MVEELIIAEPHGFCAGVKGAISLLNEAVKKHGKVFCLHEIVHNSHVVENFRAKGVVFTEDIRSVPDNSVLVLSAHGTSPEVKKIMEEKNLLVLDAVCPLVDVVHKKVKKYHEKGHDIIYIGKKGHAEVEGVRGEAPIKVISSISEVDDLKVEKKKMACLSQTTLSVDDTKEITAALIDKYPEMTVEKGICGATQQRQDAVKRLAKTCDLILVLGDKNSSNSNRLVETAKMQGREAYLILDKSELDESWLKKAGKVGITSGASCPEFLLKELVEHIKKLK